jgi:hypothetical protein
MQPVINYPAVLVAAIVQFVLGATWYSPVLFAKKWMALTGVTEEMARSMSGGQIAYAYVGSLVSFLITYYVMAHFTHYTNSKTVKQGAQTGFWLWLGFVATSLFVNDAYQNKQFTLWLIDAGYWLVSLIVGGIVLAVWQKKTT